MDENKAAVPIVLGRVQGKGDGGPKDAIGSIKTKRELESCRTEPRQKVTSQSIEVAVYSALSEHKLSLHY
jgi:hypothetical protein